MKHFNHFPHLENGFVTFRNSEYTQYFLWHLIIIIAKRIENLYFVIIFEIIDINLVTFEYQIPYFVENSFTIQ